MAVDDMTEANKVRVRRHHLQTVTGVERMSAQGHAVTSS